MIQTILRWLLLLTSGTDNKTPDVIRIGSILLGIQFMALTAYTVVVQDKPFDPMTFAGGAAALLAGTGMGTKLKPDDAPAE
jgi:hypothetical protein